MREIRITESEAGQRLDKFLGKYMRLAPVSFFYKMLRKKNIVLNGKRADGSERLVSGDLVRLYLADETIEKFMETGENGGIAGAVLSVRPGNETKPPVSPPFGIIYENRDILILNKPFGMLSQKARPQDVSLNELMVRWLLESGRVTPEQIRLQRPSVCNRLDRNTSGIVTAGITLKGLQGLSRMLRERTGEKRYYALVCGQVKDSVHRAGFLSKGADNRVEILAEAEQTAWAGPKSGIASGEADSRYFETAYRPLAYGGGCTLLEVHLITGRSHQIRAHLSAVGHGIVGDPKYGQPDINARFRQKYGLKGQLLHGASFEMPAQLCPFPELAGRRFTAPLEPRFCRVLDGLNIPRPDRRN